MIATRQRVPWPSAYKHRAKTKPETRRRIEAAPHALIIPIYAKLAYRVRLDEIAYLARAKLGCNVSDALRPFYRVLGKSADLAET